MGSPRGRVLFAALALSLAPAIARAQPAPTALHWVRLPGAESCADGATLARLVDERLGRPTFSGPARAERFIEGTIAPRGDGPGWRVVVSTYSSHGRSGARTLFAERADCAAVTPTLGLVLSLLADPDACRDGACGHAWSRPGLDGATSPRCCASWPRPSPTPPRPRSPWTLYLGGGASLLNVLASGSAHVAALWRPSRGPIAVEVGVTGLLPLNPSTDTQGPASVRATGGLAHALACVAPHDDLRVSVCAGLTAGVLRATSVGAVEPDVGVDGALAGVVRLALQASLVDRLVLRVAPSLVIPVAWPRYVVEVEGEGPREIQSAGPVGVSVEAALGWRFGG
ncbi:MAG: hypothetical protein R3A52_32020 [Polyangiales bacterium]